MVHKKRVYACDCCRASKKRCTGKMPCTRCAQMNKVCTYSGMGRVNHQHTPSKSPPPLPRPTTTVEQELTNSNITLRHFELFQATPKPLLLAECAMDYSHLAQSHHCAHQLQYYSILANTTRLFDQSPHNYLDYEHRARELAGKMIDEFSLEAAKAFHLLAFHYWGQEKQKSEHYRDICLSLCRRVFEREDHEQEDAFRLELVTMTMNDFGDPAVRAEFDSIMTTQDVRRFLVDDQRSVQSGSRHSRDPLTTTQIFHWLRLFAEMNRHIFLDLGQRPEPGKRIFKPLSENLYQQSVSMIGQVTSMMSLRHMDCYSALGALIGMSVFSIIYSAGGRDENAIACARAVVEQLEDHGPSAVGIAGPYFVTLLQWLFYIALHDQQYELAERILAIQRSGVQQLPSIKPHLEPNEAYLRSFAEGHFSPSGCHNAFVGDSYAQEDGWSQSSLVLPRIPGPLHPQFAMDVPSESLWSSIFSANTQYLLTHFPASAPFKPTTQVKSESRSESTCAETKPSTQGTSVPPSISELSDLVFGDPSSSSFIEELLQFQSDPAGPPAECTGNEMFVHSQGRPVPPFSPSSLM